MPYPYARSDAHLFVLRCRRLLRRRLSVTVALERLDEGRFVGLCELRITGPRDRRAELGYWVSPSDWGLGFAREAAARLIQEGFSTIGLHRIEAGVIAGNLRSERVLTGLGFRREGVLREWMRDGAGWDDVRHFGLLAGEPVARRGRAARAR